LVSADRAFAQTAFVQGGIVADVRRFSGQPDNRVFDGNVSTLLIGGGGFLTPMISAGVEFDTGRESVVEQNATVTIAGRPETVTTTFTSRRRAVSGLFGIHSTAGRAVRVGAYAGLAFTAFRQRIATTAPPIVLSTPPPPSEFTHLGAAPIVGVDVSVAISRRFAVAGVVRAQGLDFGGELHGFSVRPGAVVRWWF
jgi:hypothetical protein